MSDTPNYGRVPYAIVDAGGLAKMKPADVAVYLVLCAHADQEWQAYPGLNRIAHLTGLSRAAVCVATRRLAQLGVIRITRGGGRGRASCYALVTDPVNSQPPLTVSCDKNSQHPNTVSPETVNDGAPKLSTPARETVNAGALNCQRPLTPTDKNIKEQQQNTGDAAAPGCAGGTEDAGPGDPIGDALVLCGIGEPTRSGLADKLRGVRDATIKIARAAREANDRGKGVGALVRDLEALADAERVRAAQRADVKQPRPMPLAPRPPAARDWQPPAIAAAAEADEGRFAVVLARVVEREFAPARQRQIQAIVGQYGKIEAAKRDATLRAAICREMGLQPPRPAIAEVLR